jgi:hypothetical protein
MHNAYLFFLLVFAIVQPQHTSAQGTTADTSWTHAIIVGSERSMMDTLEVDMANVPVYDARARQLPDLLQQAWPEAQFKRSGNGYKATAVVVPAFTMEPVDVHLQGRDQPESGTLMVTVGFMRAGVPLDAGSTEVKTFVQELGVRLNKAVVQQQIESWRNQLGDADRKLESTSKVEHRTQQQLSDVSERVERNRVQLTEANKAVAEARSEVQRFEQRWSAKSDAADLKGLSKANARLAREQERLADLLDEQADLVERKLARSEQLPQDTQKASEVADHRATIMQIVTGLEHKRDRIK